MVICGEGNSSVFFGRAKCLIRFEYHKISSFFACRAVGGVARRECATCRAVDVGHVEGMENGREGC